MAILCILFGHKRDRHHVRHDGEDFWSKCRRCKQPMVRKSDGWHVPSEHELRAHHLLLGAKQEASAAPALSDT